MTEVDHLRRWGLAPEAQDLDEVRAVLREQVALELERDGSADTDLLKLCCTQLFTAGDLGDVLEIWRAKSASWFTACSIDPQLFCGAGLTETKDYLRAEGSDQAVAALEYLESSEAAGYFDDFSVEGNTRYYASFYGG